MKSLSALTVGAATLSLAACGSGGDYSSASIAEAIDTHCSDCHNAIDIVGDLSFDALEPEYIETNAEIWEAAVRKLRTRQMPPADAPRPNEEEYDQLVALLESELDDAATLNPGRPVLRRLNRAEYANSIRDLLGLEIDVSALLPPDDSAFGFDNIGDLLGVSPALLERYLAAADRVSALAVGDPATAPGAKTWVVPGDQSQALHQDGLPLGTVGGIAVTYNFPLDAEYEFSVELFRNNLEVIKGLHHSHQLEIAVDGQQILLENVGAGFEPEMPRGTIITDRSDATDARLRVRAQVSAGEHTVTASFMRKVGFDSARLRPFDRSNANTYAGDGRPHIETLTVAGPFNGSAGGDTAVRERIFSCVPASQDEELTCATEIVSRLARQAYRRPIDAQDLQRLLPFFEQGRERGGFEAGIQFALRRILASPSFVFRIEQDPEEIAPGTPYEVSELELATRLSYFLWSSLPDDALIDLAASGQLSEPDVLAGEVRRMLADPRADALAENFAAQWLHLRNLDTIRPNTDFYPDFDDNLRQGFKQEAMLFFMSVVQENSSVLDLLTADHTFLDERLARHYGIPGVYGSYFRRVELAPEFDMRRGLLGKGGVQMATSHADRTAPSLRGKWLLENLFGTPPPAPPPSVPALEEVAAIAPKTMRERLESHRENPNCRSCHALIDPLGFSLENYDAVGGWREFDAGADVDARGAMPDGTPLNGAIDLREALVAKPDLFAATVTEKLMIYALGRGLQHYDMPVVRGILRAAESDGYRFEAIVQGIVASPAFRMRAKGSG